MWWGGLGCRGLLQEQREHRDWKNPPSGGGGRGVEAKGRAPRGGGASVGEEKESQEPAELCMAMATEQG